MSLRSRLNLVIVQALIISLMLALTGRLFYLQVAAGLKYQDAALSIQSRDVVNPAVRGAIVDSSGIPLVMDRPGMVISVDRSKIDKLPDKGVQVLARVAKLVGKTPENVFVGTRLCGELPASQSAGCWKGTRFQPIPVTRTATMEQALKVLENSDLYPGISAMSVPVRSYPSMAGENGAHVLGYVGAVNEDDLLDSSKNYYREETIGKDGLEFQYDEYLRGRAGIKTVIVDRKEAVTKQAISTQPIAGFNLVTNLDARLQAATEKALKASVLRAKSLGGRADGGAAIVMDVKSGKILSLASYPTYDPNIWQVGLTQKQANNLFSEAAGVPALNRPMQGMYAPASTFKSVSVVAAIDAGYDMNALYKCPAKVQIGNREFANFETKSQGTVTMKRAIAVSCDTIWYQIAYDEWVRDGGLSPKSGLHDYFFTAARGFGLGKTTGIDLPSEASGRLPDRAWKERIYKENKNFYCNFKERAKKSDLTPFLIEVARENCLDGNILRAGDAVNFSIGQGDTLMTPIQMVQLYAAIANGGTIYKPQVARAIVKPNGNVVKEFKSEVVATEVLSKKATKFLHEALRAVVTEGTAAGAFSGFPIAVAGKTGTAEDKGRNKDGSAKADTAWFASFAPVDNPKYAVVMVVSQGGFGASISAVGVRDIYAALYGVVGGKVDPAKQIFPNGVPSKLPKVDPKNAKLVTP
ncbi:FtsI Cell division protein FtsI/penicillin-binding protein 2 [actinobacterium SCGC AAA044-D11]|jgi:penicillin-binding protein 2